MKADVLRAIGKGFESSHVRKKLFKKKLNKGLDKCLETCYNTITKTNKPKGSFKKGGRYHDKENDLC